jgi:uncharacterized protein DUF4157
MKSGFAQMPKPQSVSVTLAPRKALQRKCACGVPVVAGGECAECQKKRLQTKSILNQHGDHFEREANRMADFVVRDKTQGPAVRNHSLDSPQSEGSKAPNKSSAHITAPPIVHEVLENSGQPLDFSTRVSMEQRFGHDFGNVRVHLDDRAAASARSVNALAYTVGSDIVFSAGAFAPDDLSGRRLLAHELTHVVQQSDAGTARGQALQRQPDDPSTKETPVTKESPTTKSPPAKAPPRKTLKSEGVDLNDPVAGGTAAIIDRVLARSQVLAPYIGAKLKTGFKIAEKGKFVKDASDVDFDNAYRDAYDLSSGDTVPKSTKGFLNTKKSEIHLRPDALFGTALHEAVHRLASPRLYIEFLPIAKKISSTLTEVLSEGVTAFFTDEILKEEQLPNFNDAYRSKKDKAKNLIDALKPNGFDMMATFNFKGSGIVEIGEKLGFTRKQYGEAKDDGIKEVLKKMEGAL